MLADIMKVFATLFVVATSLAGTCTLVVAYLRYLEYREEKRQHVK